MRFWRIECVVNGMYRVILLPGDTFNEVVGSYTALLPVNRIVRGPSNSAFRWGKRGWQVAGKALNTDNI
jgi:hypothetical protein